MSEERKVSIDPVAKEFARRLREKLGERVEEIILFGSRGRGEAREDSDYDVLVVVRDEKLSRREKADLWKIARDIFVDMRVAADIVIQTARDAAWRKEHWSTVTYEAYREGIILP